MKKRKKKKKRKISDDKNERRKIHGSVENVANFFLVRFSFFFLFPF